MDLEDPLGCQPLDAAVHQQLQKVLAPPVLKLGARQLAGTEDHGRLGRSDRAGYRVILHAGSSLFAGAKTTRRAAFRKIAPRGNGSSKEESDPPRRPRWVMLILA